MKCAIYILFYLLTVILNTKIKEIVTNFPQYFSLPFTFVTRFILVARRFMTNIYLQICFFFYYKSSNIA